MSANTGVVAGITCSTTGIGAEGGGRGMGRGRQRCNVYHWSRRNITDTLRNKNGLKLLFNLTLSTICSWCMNGIKWSLIAWCRYTRGRFESTHGGFFLRAKPRHTPHHTHNTTQHTTQHTHTTQHHNTQHHTETERHRDRDRQKQRETERNRERDRERDRETRQDKKRKEKTRQ